MSDRTSRALAAALLAMGLAGCAAPEAPPAPLRVAVDVWPGFYPAILADEAGLFDSAGVAVELTLPSGTTSMLSEFAARRFDVATVALPDVVPLLQPSSALRVLFCPDRSVGGDVVLGRRGINTPEALRGRVIGVAAGGLGELQVHRMLRQAAVPISAVRLLNVEGAAGAAALRSGRVDAVATWDPYAAALRGEGFSVLYVSGRNGPPIYDCIVAHAEVLRERPDALRRFTAAWFAAQARLQADLEAARPLLQRRVGDAARTVSLAGVEFLSRDESRSAIARPASDSMSVAAALAEYQAHVASLGMLRRPVAVGALLAPWDR